MVTEHQIRALLTAPGMTQAILAKRLKVTQSTVSRWLVGATPSPEQQETLSQLINESGATYAAAAAASFRPTPEILEGRDLDVYAAVEGGPGEMVVSTGPVDIVQRPWFMRNVQGYAVIVTGESMMPVYEPGDMVIVNPKLQAIRNKNAIFVRDETHGEFKATVKRLVKSTDKDWHVHQYNPADGKSYDFTLPKREWPKALRIVGKYEGG